jgi:hypothetical protein
MQSRLYIAVSVAALGAAVFAPSAPAQGRHGMRAPVAAPRARSSFRVNGREGFDRLQQPRDEFENAPIAPEAPPIQIVVPQNPQPPAPAASPVRPLLLENQNGQWVRVPTGSDTPAILQSTKPDSAKVSAPNSGYVELPVAATPVPALPPAVIVFRDGHTEEVAKYMIQGETLFTNADYWSTGSWTRKIPLSSVDIPASMKLNKERGTKFNLPSGPNEVMIRF